MRTRKRLKATCLERCTSCATRRQPCLHELTLAGANGFDDELVAPRAGATRHYFSLIGVFLIRCNIWLNDVSWLVITLSS